MKNTTDQKNDRKEIFGWLMYDWANHAFFTLVLGVLVGEYVTSLAQRSVGENGAIIEVGGHVLVSAKSLFSYSVGASVFLQIFFFVRKITLRFSPLFWRYNSLFHLYDSRHFRTTCTDWYRNWQILISIFCDFDVESCL